MCTSLDKSRGVNMLRGRIKMEERDGRYNAEDTEWLGRYYIPILLYSALYFSTYIMGFFILSVPCNNVICKWKVKTCNFRLTWDMRANQSLANQPFKCSNRPRLEGGMNKFFHIFFVFNGWCWLIELLSLLK